MKLKNKNALQYYINVFNFLPTINIFKDLQNIFILQNNIHTHFQLIIKYI